MKEGQNLSYVTRIGAYGFAVVAAFAVALAVLLSVSSTSVEATIQTAADGEEADTSADANNGDTLYIRNMFETGYVRFEIETTGSASASFTHDDADEDGQSILCRSAETGTSCDATAGDTAVTVALKIDDDSGKGTVFVKQTTVPATGIPTVTTDTIDVTVAQVPANIAVSASPKSIAETVETTVLAIRLTDTDGKGIAGEGLTAIATHGSLTAALAQPDSWAIRDVETDSTEGNTGLAYTGTGSQVATLITSSDNGLLTADGAGFAAVTLTGGGAAGQATVTVRQTNGTVVGTVDVILFGKAKTIAATAEQSAIAIGESTFIVVTVTDAGDNPVAGATASVKTTGGRVPPTKLETPVAQSDTVNKDVNGDGDADKGDIPSCEAVEAQTVDPGDAPGRSGPAVRGWYQPRRHVCHPDHGDERHVGAEQ